MKEVHEMLEGILESQGIQTRMKPGSLEVDVTRCASATEVREQLTRFMKEHVTTTGWIQTTGRLGAHDDARVHDGVILCAELASEHVSMSIRQSTGATWLVSTATRGDGEGVLQVVRYRGRDPFGDQVHEVHWKPMPREDGHPVLEPVASRLIDTEEVRG